MQEKEYSFSLNIDGWKGHFLTVLLFQTIAQKHITCMCQPKQLNWLSHDVNIFDTLKVYLILVLSQRLRLQAIKGCTHNKPFNWYQGKGFKGTDNFWLHFKQNYIKIMWQTYLVNYQLSMTYDFFEKLEMHY